MNFMKSIAFPLLWKYLKRIMYLFCLPGAARCCGVPHLQEGLQAEGAPQRAHQGNTRQTCILWVLVSIR